METNCFSHVNSLFLRRKQFFLQTSSLLHHPSSLSPQPSALFRLHAFFVFAAPKFVYFDYLSYLCIQKQINETMTAIQMNAELLRNMSIIAEDENLLKRAAKYLRKLVAEKEDPTLFTKEEFFSRIDEARKQPGKQFANVEELDQYIRRL